MNERLRQFIEYLEISTRSFEQKISVSNGLVARFLTQNTTIQSNVLSKICDTYPELNAHWLITGKGEMLRQNENKNTPSEPDEVTFYKIIIADLQELVNRQREEIATLRADLEREKEKAHSTLVQTNAEPILH